MGKGIEARYARCSSYWEPHLECTRSFIAEHIQPGGRLAILGAGRLLDVDLKELIPQFSEIHLFDADRSVIRAWRKTSGLAFRETVVPRILDVTGSLSAWSSGLLPAIRKRELREYLDSLVPHQGAWESERFDGGISLNLVGQIPLYWRDRVLAAARHLSNDEERALIDSMARLQSAHLRALRQSFRAWSIVITDTEYYTYHVDRPEWEVEPALHGDVRQELLEPCSRMERHGNGCWLWHLMPQFVESQGEGCIHRVEAAAWRVVPSTMNEQTMPELSNSAL
ncbi:MAG: hypothetical protein RL518_1825 [Pseudomonadota bacterium]